MKNEGTTKQLSRQTREIETIQRITAEEYRISPALLTDKTRREPIATIRQVAMFLAREITGASYPDIAAAFNRADHGTAMWAEKQIPFKCSLHPRVRVVVDRIRNRCNDELGYTAAKAASA